MDQLTWLTDRFEENRPRLRGVHDLFAMPFIETFVDGFSS
jgi:hypothetical protein